MAKNRSRSKGLSSSASQALAHVKSAFDAVWRHADAANVDHDIEGLFQAVHLADVSPPDQPGLGNWLRRQRNRHRSAYPLREVLAELARGVFYWSTGRPEKGHACFEQARLLLPTRSAAGCHGTLLRASALNWLGTSLLNLGRYREAEAYARRGQNALSRIGIATNCRGWSYLTRGKAAYSQGKHPLARDSLVLARSDFRSMGNIFGRAEVEDALAKLALERGDCPEAREHATNSLRLRTELPFRTGLRDPLGIAKVYLLLGRIYRYEGDQQRAIEQYESAAENLKAVKQTPVEGDPVAHYQGDSLLALGDLDKARRRFEGCLRSCWRRKDTRGAIHAEYALAKAAWQEALVVSSVARRSAGLDKALRACEAALDQAVRGRRAAFPKLAAKIELLEARIYSSMGAADVAKLHYDNARDSFHRMGMIYDETEALRECGELLSSPNRLPEATRYFVQALDVCIGDRQRTRVRETVEQCISHVPVTDMCRLLADLGQRTVDLQQKVDRTVNFYSATLDIADARDFAFWAALGHAPDAAAVEHLIRVVWAPMRVALRLDEPISVRPASLKDTLQAASKGMDGTAATLTVRRTPDLSVMTDERHLRVAVCQLAEVLGQLAAPAGARPVSVKGVRKRGDVEIILTAQGRTVDEQLVEGLRRRGSSVRPGDVGLRSEDWPRYVVSDACITAMSGTLVFHSIEEKGRGKARNEFRIVLPSA